MISISYKPKNDKNSVKNDFFSVKCDFFGVNDDKNSVTRKTCPC